MHRYLRMFTLAALMLAVLIGRTASAAPPADPATLMPADTLVYIGWSQMLPENSPQLRLLDQLSTNLAGKADDRHSQLIAQALKLLPPLTRGSVAIGCFGATAGPEAPDVQLALVVDAGKDSAGLADGVGKLLAAAMPPDRIQSRSVAGVSFQSTPLPDSPFLLFWGLHQDRFIMALGETAARKVVECSASGAPTLAEAAELKFDRKKVGAQLEGQQCGLFLDVPRAIKEGKQLATSLSGGWDPKVDSLIDELGLGSVKSIYIHLDEPKGQPRSFAFVHVDGPMKGLLTLWLQQPVTDDDLKIVPKDAYWAQVCNLDLVNLWKETRRIIGTIDPDAPAQVDGVVAAAAKVIGFSITEDLLPAFGDTWMAFDAPEHGGFILTGTVLVAEAKDAAKLQALLTRCLEMAAGAAQGSPVSIVQREMKQGEHTIHYVMAGGVPVPVAPAWVFVGDRVAFALYPQTLVTALRQFDPKTRGESLLDNPDFKAARAQLPAKAVSVGYFDSKYFFRILYPFLTGLRTMGMSMLAPYGATMDLALVPTLGEEQGKITNYVSVSSVDSDGISCASAGHGTPLSMIAGGAALGFGSVMEMTVPQRQEATRVHGMADLRQIGQACIMYANDNQDEFPQSFQQLVDAKLLTPEQLCAPGDPPGTVSFVLLAKGQKVNRVREPAKTVLAYDQAVRGPQTSVLFCDGHVESVSPERRKELIVQTYKSLGREQDLPAEFK